ncbi:MAG: hypothetical protein V1806_08685 [Pseudomonadota bacterium]
MPLAFNSQSHGSVAFGFFHIESDMLLLQRMFFFAEDLCGLWRRLAAWPADNDFGERLPGFEISDPARLGDLRGAIAGRDLGGFLGALYARWPFPRQASQFAQRPAGAASRQALRKAMAAFGQALDIPVLASAQQGFFSLGGIIFSRGELSALVDYVWRGGMPGWQEGRRPDYLLETARELAKSDSPWFKGLDWDHRRVGFGF